MNSLTSPPKPPHPLKQPTFQNVLHGDLNGNNILLVAAEGAGATAATAPAMPLVAKVADFGLSRLLPLDSDRIVTRTHGEAASVGFSDPFCQLLPTAPSSTLALPIPSSCPITPPPHPLTPPQAPSPTWPPR